jgi:hypothetical protein
MIHLFHRRGPVRALGWMLMFTLSLATVGSALAQTGDQRDLDSLFQPALDLRADSQNEAAIANLREIQAADANDDEVVKLAYDYLFLTLYFDPDPTTDLELASTIREALQRYPDLVPGDICPKEILVMVQVSRVQMYGSLQITNPEGAEITLDGEPRGMSPLLLEFVPVGERRLTVAKDGYKERQEFVTIAPGERLSRDMELSARSNKAWYIAGGLALVGGTLYLLLKGGDDDDLPLPEPPLPPTAR